MKTLGLRIVLGALVAWAAVSWAVSASYLWTPQGTIGVHSNYGGEISSVDPGSPADRAGIVAGDRIVLDRTPFESRPKLIGAVTPIAIGTVVPFSIERNGQGRNLVLTAVPIVQPERAAERFSLFINLISTAIFIVVGAGLMLLRPSLVTWGFGLFCLLTNPVVPALSRFPSATAHLWYVLIYDVIQNVGILGLLVFALNFPMALQERWRAILAHLLWPIFIVLAAWTMFIDIAVCILALPVRQENAGLQVAFALVDVLAIVLITETYLRGPVANRPRLRWVLFGFYFGLVCNFIGNLFLYTSNAALPWWIDSILVATEVTLPIAVAYAVIRHRVLDVDFFFSRALVYAVFTTVLVSLFALSDWFFGRVVEDFRFSIVLNALISIGLALTFDRMQDLFERGLDFIIFRGRRVGADRLARTGRTLRFVTEDATVDATLVNEPHETLEIEALALFRRVDNRYERVSSIGWDGYACKSLSVDDRLIVEHLAHEGLLHVADIPWEPSDIPHGSARPALSVPLRSGSMIEGVLLCSLKRHGEQLDPEEQIWLRDFVIAGAVAYARLEAERLRDRAHNLEREVVVLNARLDEAHKA